MSQIQRKALLHTAQLSRRASNLRWISSRWALKKKKQNESENGHVCKKCALCQSAAWSSAVSAFEQIAAALWNQLECHDRCDVMHESGRPRGWNRVKDALKRSGAEERGKMFTALWRRGTQWSTERLTTWSLVTTERYKGDAWSLWYEMIGITSTADPSEATLKLQLAKIQTS